MGTLRPCPEESVDWDTTQNLFIEGDNLEVLKILQKSYAGKIKVIYIDPPYNTGKEFIYPDKFHDNLDTYLRYTGQKGEDGLVVSSNNESSGRFHTNWLSMMYPRLKIARSLLTHDGVIFISIDDGEQPNLRKICDEIFGEENFISCIMRKRKKEISSDSKNVSIQGEYVLAYAKSNEVSFMSEPLSEKYIAKTYKEPTREFPEGKWRPVPITVSKGLTGGGYRYSITTPGGTTHDRLWAYPKEGYERLLKSGRVYFGANKNGVPQRVIYAHESNGQPTTNYWDNSPTNKEGKKEVLNIFGDNVFDTPKPTALLQRLIALVSKEEDIILDFFSGSCATAHAVMKGNVYEKTKRKFIMVQLPEPCDKNSSAFKSGFSTIAELGKERIRRVISQLSEDNLSYSGDLGFKVFKLESSNIVAWNPDKSDLENTLMAHSEHLVPGRSEQDVLYELLLKRGVELTAPIEEKEIAGKKVYSIGFGVLFACLDKKIQRDQIEELAHGIIDWHKELDPISDTQVVFRDSAFENDVTKANMTAILEQSGIKHVRSL
jgi:adenine-specific DNA-methyltransferase